MADQILVVLVEDNDVFREALELLLGLRPEMRVIASVADGADAARVAAELCPDVVLMDYRLPGLDGVQATRAVLKACPDTAVVCLTAEATERERDALLEAGAVGCLEKDEGLDAIVAAIHDAAKTTA
jgi:two-component system, NarL family, response regulator LiaR